MNQENIMMNKRKTETSESAPKKLKKSVEFASKVQIREISNNGTEPKKFAKKIKKTMLDSKSTKATFLDKLNKLPRLEKIVSAKMKRGKNNENSSVEECSSIKVNSKNQNGVVNEKIDWSEFRKQKKALKKRRKEMKFTNYYAITQKAKAIGEKLRLEKSTSEERTKNTLELHELLKGHYSRLIFTHDLSRVIQWQIKYSNQDILQSIKSELESSFLKMIQSKYAKHCVKALFKYGSDQLRKELLSLCYGHVVQLSSHLISAPIFEYAIIKFATDQDKIRLKQEFYGDMYKETKDNSIKTLEDIISTAEDMKKATLSAMKLNLIRILNKKLPTNPIVHTVLHEFLSNCTNEDRDEIFAMIRSFIVELSRTREGVMAVMIMIQYGTNKDRKILMKTLKEHVKDISVTEHGYLLFLSLFDCVDDTVLLRKVILSEILKNLTTIAFNEYGRRIILYIVARRDPCHFHPALVDSLKKNDDTINSKKPAEVREKEILNSVIDQLLESITLETENWLKNSANQILTLAILKSNHISQNLKGVFESIVDYIVNPESKIFEENSVIRAIEHAGLHMILKKLIQRSNIFKEKNGISFAEILVDRLNEKALEYFLETNRSCFLLISILENSSQVIASKLVRDLESMKEKLEILNSKGSEILMQKLNDFQV